jgi:hypothetical protein
MSSDDRSIRFQFVRELPQTACRLFTSARAQHRLLRIASLTAGRHHHFNRVEIEGVLSSSWWRIASSGMDQSRRTKPRWPA